eukprot:4296163-Karenia_brevis.AAC.2
MTMMRPSSGFKGTSLLWDISDGPARYELLSVIRSFGLPKGYDEFLDSKNAIRQPISPAFYLIEFDDDDE